MKSIKVKDLTVVALFVAIVSLCSFITMYFGTIPLTLQLLGVFCATDVLGPKRSFAAVVCYLLLGAVGLPIFNGFTGGLGNLFGATGGFLLSFLFVPPVVGLICRFKKNFVMFALGNFVGIIVCHICGVLWYWLVFIGDISFDGLLSSLLTCSLPFLLPDIIKAIVAAFLSDRVRKIGIK